MTQRLRTPGFEASPNWRIDAAIGTAAAELERAGHDAIDAIALAIRRVLPAAAIGRNSMRDLRPSKSDDAAWRRGKR